MSVALIAALSCNGVIGRDGDLPWHLPADLAHFKKHTQNRTVVMGRKTFESIGRPLPRRRNIVLTRGQFPSTPAVEYASDLSSVLDELADDDIMIIGGASLYAEALGLVSRMYLTIVHQQVKGDVFFPVFDEALWSVRNLSRRAADARNNADMTFLELTRQNEGSGFKPLKSPFPQSYCL